MKRIVFLYISFLATALLVCAGATSCSCSKETADKDFIESEELMLKIDGKVVFRFDESNCQLAHSQDRLTFRATTDDMTKYYQLTCNQIPYSQGQNLKGTLRYSTGTSVSTKEDLSFRIEKVTEDGRFWLWCSSRKIGISIQQLK